MVNISLSELQTHFSQFDSHTDWNVHHNLMQWMLRICSSLQSQYSGPNTQAQSLHMSLERIKHTCTCRLNLSIQKMELSFINPTNYYTAVTSSSNGPFAANGHMVQNPPCWRASYPLGHPKQRKFKFVLMKSLCSGCPSGQLALQHGGFCTM